MLKIIAKSMTIGRMRQNVTTKWTSDEQEFDIAINPTV